MERTYTVVHNDIYEFFLDDVNELITQGWRPQGSVTVQIFEADNESFYHYFQAMVRPSGNIFSPGQLLWMERNLVEQSHNENPDQGQR